MKFMTIDLEPGPDGSLSEKQLDELTAKMHSVIDEQLPETAREEARRRADELVAELRGQTHVQMSVKGLVRLLTAAEEMLEKAPRAIRGIAQSLDTPSHIYDLGGASSEVVIALAAVAQAKKALQDTLECDHCKAEPTKENLS